MREGLEELERKYPQLVSRVRGLGTFLAFDLPDAAQQGKFLNLLRQSGVEATGSGTKSIRFRPMLIFGM